MKAPQIIMLVLIAMDIGIHLAKNGQPRTDCYNVYWELFGKGLLAALLWWGGFFNG